MYVLEWFWHKSGLGRPWWPLSLHLRLDNVNIIEKFKKDWVVNKKYITEKDDFMTNLRLHNHNISINECARNKKDKIPASNSFRVSQFFVRYRRTCVFNNYNLHLMHLIIYILEVLFINKIAMENDMQTKLKSCVYITYFYVIPNLIMKFEYRWTCNVYTIMHC